FWRFRRPEASFVFTGAVTKESFELKSVPKTTRTPIMISGIFTSIPGGTLVKVAARPDPIFYTFLILLMAIASIAIVLGHSSPLLPQLIMACAGVVVGALVLLRLFY